MRKSSSILYRKNAFFNQLNFSTYNQYVFEANQLIKDRLTYEIPLDPNSLPKDKASAFQHFALLYVKYIQIFRKVEV